MASYAIGDRVGAILESSATEVKLVGYGTYQGMEESPLGRASAKLVMDDGQVFWGACGWWSSESSVKRFIGDRKVVTVPAPVLTKTGVASNG